MDSETVKVNARQLFDYVNKKDTEALIKWIDNFIGEEFVNHTPALPDESTNREGFKNTFCKLIQMFPEMKITIREMVFEDDILCFRLIMQGFGSGHENLGIVMLKYRDGKIVDRWLFSDLK